MNRSDASKDSRRPRRQRISRRRRSHAQAIVEPFEPTAAPEHVLIPPGPPQFIDDDQHLADLLADVRRTGRCCYDTEFIGESFYYPRLCLIQIATPQRIAVIDALAAVDLKPIWELLADASVLKIVHAGEQDLEPVVRLHGAAPANIFDTQIAAGFAALPYPISLRRLTQELVGVKLGKQLTFTSWDHRPLSEAHLHYAADDVRFGLALHAELAHRIEQRGHQDRVMAECGRLCDSVRYELDLAEVAQKIRSARGLNRAAQAVLHELVLLRDELARLHDLPPRSTLRDEVLMDLARRAPQTRAELDAIRGLPRPLKVDFGQRLLEAVQHGRQQRRPPWPSPPAHEEEPGEQFSIDSLWAAAQAHCRSLGIEPGLATTRNEAAEAYRALRAGRALNGRLSGGWRHEVIGQFLADLLAGRGSLALRWHDGLRSTAAP